MIDFLKQQVASAGSSEAKANKLREILQLMILKILQDKGYFENIAFVGGTALRILYNIRRFSEDLDFSVINKDKYDFKEIISKLKHELKLLGLQIEAKTKIDKTVQSSMLGFPGLLKELGISQLKDQKISIKLEADSSPPEGWQIEETIINNIYVLNITHLNLPSLYATKMHACFFRKYAKGRDFYDLVWYLGKRIQPNYNLLNNAIKQTEGTDPGINKENITDFLLKRLNNVDFKNIKKDVERFLEDKNELKLLDKDIIAKNISVVFKA